MVVAAFRALLRTARNARGAPLNGWIAWGGIGALATLCLDSMMTFPLQLPALILLLFAILPLGAMLGSAAGDAKGFQMPPLVLQGRWGQTVLHLRGMKRIVAISASLLVPRGVATALVVLLLLGGATGIWLLWRPLRSDVAYRRAHDTRLLALGAARQGISGSAQALSSEADSLYQRALSLWPRHHDCRSEYSQFLLENGRYDECIEHLAIVFQRLDSRELYARRRDAYLGLGLKALAKRDDATYWSRVPAPLRPPPPGEDSPRTE